MAFEGSSGVRRVLVCGDIVLLDCTSSTDGADATEAVPRNIYDAVESQLPSDLRRRVGASVLVHGYGPDWAPL